MLNGETAGDPHGRVWRSRAPELPALLLELPRDEEGRLQSADPVHERGRDRLGQARAAKAFAGPIGADDSRQVGVVVAYDPKNGKSRPIWGMGRHNHENSVAIPGYGDPVLLSGDDAFVSNPAQSQVYALHREELEGVWNDRGDLWAFVSNVRRSTTTTTSLGASRSPSRAASSRCRRTSPRVASPNGDRPHGRGQGLSAPAERPARGRRFPSGIGVDGPQWVLEHWGDREQTSSSSSGSRTSPTTSAAACRTSSTSPTPVGARRSAGGNAFTLDQRPHLEDGARPADPTKVTSLSILVEGDDAPGQDARRDPPAGQPRLHGERSLLITEDPGSSQQFYRRSDSRTRPRGGSDAQPEVATRRDKGSRQGRSVRRRRADRRRRGTCGQSGRVGVERRRRRLGGVRAGRVPGDVQAHSLWSRRNRSTDLALGLYFT